MNSIPVEIKSNGSKIKKFLSNKELIAEANKIIKPLNLVRSNMSGLVGSALQTKSGNVYHGVWFELSSGMGNCAEHSAVAAMLTAGETEIVKVATVWRGKKVVPPCGRCAETISQTHKSNHRNTIIVLGENKEVKLCEILPYSFVEEIERDEKI